MKPGFKQTEVGVIPEDWEVQQMGKISAITTGRKDVNEGNPNGEFPFFTCSRVHTFSNSYSFDTEAILIAGNGDVGNLHYYSGQFEAYQRTYVVHKFSAHVQYLLHQLHYRLIESLGLGKIGTSIPYIKKENLTGFSFPLPPTRAEQEAIAGALGDADALIESLERLIAKKRDIKQGAMQELLTGQRRLPGFTGKWKTLPLRNYVKRFIVPMRDKPKKFIGEIPWCRIEDFDGTYLTGSKSEQYIDAETVRAMNLKIYPTGTLLVSCSADLGRCAIVACPLVSNQTFIGLEMNEVAASNLYFFYYMTSKAEELNNLSSGTTISYLSREQFEEFHVYVPRDKDEQTAIASVLSDIDEEIMALEAKLAKARAIKQGMMQELLTGRIRLK